MKKFYTKLMALACMFMLAGANAMADSWVAWVGPRTNVSLTITTSYADQFVTNLQAKANSQISYSWREGYDDLVGVSVTGSKKLYLKPTTDGFINLRLACASGNPLTVTIHDNTDNKDVASVNVVTPTVTYTYYGETVLFEVVADHEYILNASDNKTYYVTVVSKMESSETVSLSEEQTASEVESAIGEGITLVKMHRTLKAGVWNTFSSPIQLGTNAMRAELKCEEAYELSGYSDSKATFTKTDKILANKAYLIMPSENVTDITVSNRSHPASYAPQATTIGSLSFVPVLGATNIYDANNTNYFVSNNTLKYPSSEANGTIKGFRAYFHLANGAQIKDFTFEDDATGIITVESDPFEENATVYSIDGRNMGNAKNLTRGLYIQNGRKFIVK